MSKQTFPTVINQMPNDRFKVVMSDERDRDDRDNDGRGVGVLEAKPKTKTKKPSLYKVLMLNDDYTPMEFVVHVLVNFLGSPTNRQRKLCCMCIKKASAYAVFTRLRWPRPRSPKPLILPVRTITRFSVRLKKTTSLRQIFLPIGANCSHCRLDFSRECNHCLLSNGKADFR